jgi:hypothetical protein
MVKVFPKKIKIKGYVFGLNSKVLVDSYLLMFKTREVAF